MTIDGGKKRAFKIGKGKNEKNNKEQGNTEKGFISIRYIFALPFFIQLFSVTLLMSFILYQGSQAVAESTLKELNSQILKRVDQQLVKELQNPIELNEINWNAYKSNILDTNNQLTRERYFINHLKAYKNVAMTYIALPDGQFYGARRTDIGSYQVVRNNQHTMRNSEYYRVSDLGDGQELEETFKNFDPRLRPWYLAAKVTEDPIFTQVYSHFVFKEPTITAARAVIVDGKLEAVLGVDYLLTWLANDLAQIQVGKLGLVYIENANGELIASSKGGSVFIQENTVMKLKKASNSGIPLIEDANNAVKSVNNDAVVKFSSSDNHYLMSSTTITEYGLDWKVYVAIAEKDYLGPLEIAIRNTFGVVFIATIAFLVVTYLMAKSILKPVIQLNKASKALGDGHLEKVDDGSRKDEFGQLIRSFNRMGSELVELVSDLENQVAERTKELEEKNVILENLSFLDGLTGISNRRKLDEVLVYSWQSAMRSNRNVVMLMLDLDHFKNYNDAYGHNEGDQCLKKVANVLMTHVKRSSDLAARYGGEEFAIILNNTRLETGIQMADEICKDIRALNIEHVSSEWGVVTVSIGVAVLMPRINTSEITLIELADQALYMAKNNGRNRYEILG